jgi:hypothetical protein
MNRLFSLLTAVLLVAACNGQTAHQKAPVTAPDRTSRHSAGICPNWAGAFIGDTSNRVMQIRMSKDARNSMVLEDVGVETWVINGQGQPRSGFPGQSYVAYCSSSTSTNGKVDLSTVGNITIEAYDGSSQLLFTITYTTTSTGFKYSDLDGVNNQPLEPTENFTPKK